MKCLLFVLSLAAALCFSNISSAERVNGPGVVTFHLKPDQEIVYKIYLKADKPHRFIGAGTGGEVDYLVFDPVRLRIAHDYEIGSDCHIEFTPKLPGVYFFYAKNYSDEEANVVVKTN